jgi:hypothetical protein
MLETIPCRTTVCKTRWNHTMSGLPPSSNSPSLAASASGAGARRYPAGARPGHRELEGPRLVARPMKTRRVSRHLRSAPSHALVIPCPPSRNEQRSDRVYRSVRRTQRRRGPWCGTQGPARDPVRITTRLAERSRDRKRSAGSRARNDANDVESRTATPAAAQTNNVKEERHIPIREPERPTSPAGPDRTERKEGWHALL